MFVCFGPGNSSDLMVLRVLPFFMEFPKKSNCVNTKLCYCSQFNLKIVALWHIFDNFFATYTFPKKSKFLGLISKKYRPAVIQPSQPSTGSSRVGVKFHKKFKYDPQTSTTRLGAAGLAASLASRLQNLQGGG